MVDPIRPIAEVEGFFFELDVEVILYSGGGVFSEVSKFGRGGTADIEEEVGVSASDHGAAVAGSFESALFDEESGGDDPGFSHSWGESFDDLGEVWIDNVFEETSGTSGWRLLADALALVVASIIEDELSVAGGKVESQSEDDDLGDWGSAQDRIAVTQLEKVGCPPFAMALFDNLDLSEKGGNVVAIGSGVADEGSADGAGDPDGEFESAESGLGGFEKQVLEGGATIDFNLSGAVDVDLVGSVVNDKPGNPLISRKDIAAPTKDRSGETLGLGKDRGGGEIIAADGITEVFGATTGFERREEVEPNVLGDSWRVRHHGDLRRLRP